MVEFFDGDKQRAERFYHFYADGGSDRDTFILCGQAVMEEEITHDLNNLGLLDI